MRRCLSSLLAVLVVAVLVGVAVQPATALAARGSSHAEQPSSPITHNASTHPERMPGRRGSAVVPVLPGAGYDHAGGSRPVRALQRLLMRAGDTPGPIDGRYGPLTQRAVQRYQAAHGLQVDGIAGPQTLTHLNLPAVAHPHVPASSHRRSRPLPTRSRPMPHPPISAPAPTSAPAPISAGHPHAARTPSTWQVLLGILALGLLLVAVSYVRERRVIRHSIRTSLQAAQMTQLAAAQQAARRSEAEENLLSAKAAWWHTDHSDGPLENGDDDACRGGPAEPPGRLRAPAGS